MAWTTGSDGSFPSCSIFSLSLYSVPTTFSASCFSIERHTLKFRVASRARLSICNRCIGGNCADVDPVSEVVSILAFRRLVFAPGETTSYCARIESIAERAAMPSPIVLVGILIAHSRSRPQQRANSLRAFPWRRGRGSKPPTCATRQARAACSYLTCRTTKESPTSRP